MRAAALLLAFGPSAWAVPPDVPCEREPIQGAARRAYEAEPGRLARGETITLSTAAGADSTLRFIEVRPNTLWLPRVGERRKLWVNAYMSKPADEHFKITRGLTYSSDKPEIAEVTQDGVVIARGKGATNVRARLGKEKFGILVVVDGPGAPEPWEPPKSDRTVDGISQVYLYGPQLIKSVGETRGIDLQGHAWRTGSSVGDLSVAPKTRYRVSPATVAVSVEPGYVVGVAPGRAVVEASYGTLKAEPFPIEVAISTPVVELAASVAEPPRSGKPGRLDVRGRLADGRWIRLTCARDGARYRVDDPSVARVGADGALTAKKKGRTRVIAAHGPLETSVDLEVTP